MKKLSKLLVSLFVCCLIIINFSIPKISIINTESKTNLVSNDLKKTSKQKIKNLAIFINFKDSSTNVINHLDDEESVNNAYNLFNSDELLEMNTVNGIIKVPSFKKYYERESYGELNITTEIFPKQNGKVVSYTDPHPIGYYLRYSETNKIGYKNKSESLERETELIDNAILYVSSQIMDAGITENEIDTNNDGQVDAISFIVEGQANTVITWGDLLWSHKLDNTGLANKIIGKKIVSYNLIYATDYKEAAGLFSLNRGGYGTIIHEFGHTLGFMDLYRYNTLQEPVGFYDIMGRTSTSNPGGFLTYFISEYQSQTNWHSPLQTVTKTTDNITLYKPEYQNKDEKRAIKVMFSEEDKEYFIIEYHEKLNTYETSSADKSGLIVYRVNENNKFLGNTSGGDHGELDHIYVFRPGETVLGEGKGNLSKATLNINRRTLGSDISNDKTFDNNSIFYSDGTNSGIKIEVTNETDNSVTFNLIFPKTEGSGTKEDPYLINDVNSFLYHMNLNTKNKYYKLTDDLDFVNIEYPNINFDGNLDGNNKTLRNIKTNNGLFNDINISNFQNQTEIKNLNIENITVKSNKGSYLGAFASTGTNVTFKNIHLISGSVTNEGSLQHDSISTGGLIGNANNSVIIEDCYSNLTVSAEKNVGGLVGLNMNAQIKNSFVTGEVKGESFVGGFIGLQLINDDYYNIPSNVYYKSNETNLKAVGGYDKYLHNLNVLSESSLSKGIYSVSVPSNLSLPLFNSVNFIPTINPNSNINYNVIVEDFNLANYKENKILALSKGNTKIFTDIIVGNNIMRLTTNLTIKESTTNLTESDLLNYLGIIKKENYIFGFKQGTKVEDIKQKLHSLPNLTVKSIKNNKNAEIENGIITTGTTLTFLLNNIEYKYCIVIKGDVNGDGLIYATDYVKIKNHIMGKSTLTGAYLLAADINNDGLIHATDYVKVKNHIMGKTTISQK